MTKPSRIDWWQVITDLERAEVSHERIAAECLRSKGWVDNLKNTPGTEPRFHDGAVLLGLWATYCGAAGRVTPVLALELVRKG